MEGENDKKQEKGVDVDVEAMLKEANEKAKAEVAHKEDANDYSRFDDISSDSDDEISDSDGSGEKISVDERLIRAESCKSSGNSSFKEKENQEALKMYNKGLDFLKPLEKMKVPNILEGHATKRNELFSSLILNKVAVLNREEKWKESIESSNNAIQFLRENDNPKQLVKALFRRGVAYKSKGDLEESKKDLVELLKLDPKNREALKYYTIVKKALTEAREKQKQSFGNIFEKGGGMYNDKEKERKKRELREKAKREKLKKEHEKVNKDREENGEPLISFEDWEAERKKEEEEKEKKKKEEEEERRKEREARNAKLREERRKREQENDTDEIELDEEDLAAIKAVKEKGYCHFRKEKTADEIELLSHIRPNRIGSEDDLLNTTGVSGSESAWNQAKTWEERDVSESTRKKLREMVKQISHESEDGSIKLSVKSIEKVSGEAQIVMVNGKKGPVYDMSLELNWVAEFDKIEDDALYEIDGDVKGEDSSETKKQVTKVRGGMTFNEITNGIKEHHFECATTLKSSTTSPEDRALVEQEVLLLVDKVRAVIIDVVDNAN